MDNPSAFVFPQIVYQTTPLELSGTGSGRYGPITGNLFGAMNVVNLGGGSGFAADVVSVSNGTLTSPQLSLDAAAYCFGYDLNDNAFHIVNTRAVGYLEAGLTTISDEKCLNTIGHGVCQDYTANLYYPNAMVTANTDGQDATQVGLQGVVNRNYLFNGASWDRQVSGGNSADAVAAATNGLNLAVSTLMLFNGAAFDRARSASAANISGATQIPLLTSAPGDWTLTVAPAAGAVASSTKAAGAAGVRHVLTSICADVNAVAAIAAPLILVVRDGATGAGAILWQRRLTALIGTTVSVQISGLNIVGSAATAMTVEFTAAPAGTDFETISATGHSV